MKRYNPIEIEQKWQDKWERTGIYHVDLDDATKPKYLGFSMLPGITGAGIHIGHGRTFQFSDIKVRAKRQQGFNAYNPIGWDSFGLPVENYAIKVGKKPRQAHDDAKANFIRQLKRLGYSYDWSKEISTADPRYYKWTQWIFNQLLKHDLAYQKEQDQWWCETDNTVLANEQVEGGKCWRCGNPVVKKKLKQWFFRITAYADEMLEATDDLNWTDMVKTMQKNWIGKSQGAEVEFTVVDGESRTVDAGGNKAKDSFVFAPELAELVRNGEKTATIRRYARKLNVGDVAELLTGSEDSAAPLGYGRITNIRSMLLKDIPNNLEGHAPLGSDEQRLVEFTGYYGDDITLDTEFTIYDFEFSHIPDGVAINVFTTRPDTLFGATFIVLAPEHELVQQITTSEQKAAVQEYVKQAAAKSDLERQEGSKEKTGVFTGAYATNPVTGGKIPIWIADYVLTGYGTGAIMAVPAHDERDGAFATKFNLPITEVIERPSGNTDEFYAGEGLMINSGQFDGETSSQAREDIVAWLEQQGIGRAKVQYKMRDWLISRQRYWGAPIPIVHVDGKAIPVADECLPVELPDVEDFKPHGGHTSALADVDDWVRVYINTKTGVTAPITEPKPQGDDWVEGRRETDTMDGYACSSWYFLRYIDPFNNEEAWSKERASHWQPVDYYNGADHAVAHLLYSRFWMRFFYKLGLVPTPEPFKRMMYNAYIMAPDGQKMSKSKGNVIDPMEIMDSGYGADSLRVYEMFIAPYDQDAPWDTRGVPGTYRFLNRVWNLVQEYIEASEGEVSEQTAKQITKTAHATIKKVTSDIQDDKFNTAIAYMMESVNTLYKLKEQSPPVKCPEWQFALESLLMVLAPFAPHITEELWHDLGYADTIHVDHWPDWDDALIADETMMIIVQVNGKLRAKLELAKDTTEQDVKNAALADGNVQKHLNGVELKKVIYIPGKLVNVVS